MLAKTPDERYQHLDDLIVDLRSVLRKLTPQQQAALPVAAAEAAELPTATLGPGQGPRRRSVSPLLIAVTLAVLLAMALVWLSFGRSG